MAFLPLLLAEGALGGIPPVILVVLGILAATTVGCVVFSVRVYRRLRRFTGKGVVQDAGFAFDEHQGIFYSGMDPWQRKFGYCQLYDEAAPALNMIIDCEPFRFSWDDREWLVELWKGQYGMTTGAEVGVYVSDRKGLTLGDFHTAFYKAVDDGEMLSMVTSLYKNNRLLYTRAARHWWLTGFVPGEFSQLHELVLETRITFLSPEMCGSFVQAARRLGYGGDALKASGNTAHIRYAVPHTPQAAVRARLEQPVQELNQRYCAAYQSATGAFDTVAEKMEYLRTREPALYTRLLAGIHSSEQYQALSKLTGN